MQLTEYEKRLLHLIKRHGPQDIPKTAPALVMAACKLIDWQLASYNGAGRLEVSNKESM